MIELRNKDANNYFLDYTGELCDKFILLRELAFYSNEIKSLFLFLGVGDSFPLHSSKFIFDPIVLEKG
jgi:hypothetical protein